jgi:hypothetical protein
MCVMASKAAIATTPCLVRLARRKWPPGHSGRDVIVDDPVRLTEILLELA